MDIRLLLLILGAVALIAFFIGRRTAPGGRAVHKLQKDLDSRAQELAGYQQQMHQFMVDMQDELDRVSSAYRDLQAKVKDGSERLVAKRGIEQFLHQQAARLDARADNDEHGLQALVAEPASLEPPRDYSPVRGSLSQPKRAYA